MTGIAPTRIFPAPPPLLLGRLVRIRWACLAVLLLVILLAPAALGIVLAKPPLLATLGLAALFNFVASRQTGLEAASPEALFSHLSLDIATLAAFVFFSGGVTNPLISLLLLPVALAALTLPFAAALGVAFLGIVAYSLLLFFYLPLPFADPARATQLHLVGMWLTFAVSALAIAWIVARTTGRIRERDAELAAIREEALRSEQVLALGTLAAGAAHELGSPLASMALIAGELQAEAGISPAGQADLALLQSQIMACKRIISGLSHQAGAARLEDTRRQPLDTWADTLRRRWHSLCPQAESRLACLGDGPAPELIADPRLEQALINLLNNAARSNPLGMVITVDWQQNPPVISVADRGPGFPEAVLQQGGEVPFPAHAGGSGIGLLLTRTALKQMGARLILSNPQGGGALARIELGPTQP